MLIRRLAYGAMLCFSTWLCAACADRPSVVGAHTSQRVPEARPADFDAAEPSDSEGAVPIDAAEPVPERAGEVTPPALAPIPRPEPGPPRASKPRPPTPVGDGFPVFPMPGPVMVDPAVPTGVGPDNLEPPLPIARCFGQAIGCDRINVYMTWLNDCGDQNGCTLDMACLAKDTLACADVSGEDDCVRRGCNWHVPKPQLGGVENRRSWLDWRRYVDVVNHEIIDPVVQVELNTPSRLNNVELALGTQGQQIEQPGYCVAPERPEATALCQELTSAVTCNARDAVCVWHPVACTGQAVACDSIMDAQACAQQLGCAWGVE